MADIITIEVPYHWADCDARTDAIRRAGIGLQLELLGGAYGCVEAHGVCEKIAWDALLFLGSAKEGCVSKYLSVCICV